MAQFDLGDIFRDVFGYDPPTAQPVIQRKTASNLGQPYYATDLFGREFFLPVTLDGILIPFAVLGMTWKKIIVNTPMPERGGSVKEIVSIDDYKFNLKGILIIDEFAFPESEIIKIHDLFTVNKSVPMRSVISDIVLNGTFNHAVVIKEIKWPPVTGIEHVKPFEMDLESDSILDLEID